MAEIEADGDGMINMDGDSGMIQKAEEEKQ